MKNFNLVLLGVIVIISLLTCSKEVETDNCPLIKSKNHKEFELILQDKDDYGINSTSIDSFNVISITDLVDSTGMRVRVRSPLDKIMYLDVNDRVTIMNNRVRMLNAIPDSSTIDSIKMVIMTPCTELFGYPLDIYSVDESEGSAIRYYGEVYDFERNGGLVQFKLELYDPGMNQRVLIGLRSK